MSTEDEKYNLPNGGLASERSRGTVTLDDWNGFKAGDIALCDGVRGTIRRFFRHRGSNWVNVDFLPEGYTYTGFYSNAECLKKLPEAVQSSDSISAK